MRSVITRLCLAIFFCGAHVSSGFAAGHEQVQRFTFDAQVNKQASATITEQIVYDFGASERRGIFRDVPTSYVVDGNQGFELEFAVLSVERDGKSEPYQIEQQKPLHTTLRIGNPDVTISGVHTYTLQYQLSPVAVISTDGSQIIRFDVPGVGWDVAVNEVQATLETPNKATAIYCYTGTLGATEQDCKSMQNGDVASFSASNLGFGKTLTIEGVFDASTYSQTASLSDIDIDPGNNDSAWPALLIVGLVVTPMVFFGTKRIFSAVRYRRRRSDETVYPRYEPPQHMTPGELGLLIDNSISGAELSATLLYLAVNGHLKITQTRPKSFFRSPAYTFQKKDGGTALDPYHSDVVAKMFAEAPEPTLESLKKNQGFITAVGKMRASFVANLEKLGYYKPLSVWSSDLDARMTDEGYKNWAQIAGFRMFLEFTEKDRLNYHDAPEKNPEQFSAFLPYAVALGVEKQWAQQFRDLQIDTSEWYVGAKPPSGGYTAQGLSQLGSELSSFTASAASSGFSGGGGGYSGGGFSGGGGGSW